MSDFESAAPDTRIFPARAKTTATQWEVDLG